MKFILKFIATFLLVLLSYYVAIQGFSPVYELPLGKPFSGDNFFNPYSGVDFGDSIKSNFHAHTRFDNIGDFTEDDFEQIYKDSKYDYIGVSNHNIVTNSLSHRSNYIPTYEHGFNLNNYHILALDAKAYNFWVNNMLMALPRSQMQWVINRLRDDSQILSLNHPERLRLAPKSNYKYLRGYDLMEANTNNIREVWDEVLGEGNYIPLLSSDDSHSIDDIESRLQRAYTIVLGENTPQGILDAIKAGHSYGVVGRGRKLGEDHPRFKGITIERDTVWVEVDRPANTINAISNGEVFASSTDTTKIAIPTQNINNYVRFEAIYDNTTLVSNPIARNDSATRPAPLPLPEINIMWTIINSTIWGLLAILILYFTSKMWCKKKKKPKRKKIGNFENHTWGMGLKPYDPS